MASGLLWRLGQASRKAPKKSQWVAAGREGCLRDGLIDVGGWRVRPAPNYVLFETEDEGTCVLADPRTVATGGSRGAVGRGLMIRSPCPFGAFCYRARRGPACGRPTPSSRTDTFGSTSRFIGFGETSGSCVPTTT